MVMRMERAAEVSRAAGLLAMGGRFTDKTGLTEACIRLRPRNRNAPGKNRPGDDVNDKNQNKQDQPRSPSLTMPIIVRGEGISKDHHRQGSRGMSPARAPELIAKSGEQERGRFTGDAGEGQQNGSQDATISGRYDDGGNGLPFAG